MLFRVAHRHHPESRLKTHAALRSAHREGKRIVKTKIANITHWPPDVVEAPRRALKGEKLVPVRSFFESESTLPHGHVEAILGTVRKLRKQFNLRDIRGARSNA